MIDEEKTDQELVRATLADKHEYRAIVDRYEGPLSRYITRLGCRDREAAKDILQDVFIKVYVNLNDYDSTLSLGAWMYRIAHNETVSYFRKQKIRPIVFQSEDDLEIFKNIMDETDTTTEHEKKALQQSVRNGLQDLDEQYRSVLILRFFEEKSYEEISDILQIPTGTVATYISRGKQKLKEKMKKIGYSGV